MKSTLNLKSWKEVEQTPSGLYIESGRIVHGVTIKVSMPNDGNSKARISYTSNLSGLEPEDAEVFAQRMTEAVAIANEWMQATSDVWESCGKQYAIA